VPIHDYGGDAANTVASSLRRNAPLVHVQHLDIVILSGETLHSLLHRHSHQGFACSDADQTS
jgi:hypothetical protein